VPNSRSVGLFVVNRVVAGFVQTPLRSIQSHSHIGDFTAIAQRYQGEFRGTTRDDRCRQRARPAARAARPRERHHGAARLLAGDKLLAELEADDAARAAFCIATGAELRATARAQCADAGDKLVRLRGTKRKTRERDVPMVTEWQRTLLAYALEHARGNQPALFKKKPDEFR